MRSPSFFSAMGMGIGIALTMALFTEPAMADMVPGSDPDLEVPATLTTPTPRNNEHDDGASRDEPPPTSFVRGLAGVGASNGGVFGVRSTAVHLGGGLTVDSGPHVAVPLSLEIDAGESPGGLKVIEAALSFGLQGVIGRFRIGGGLELSHMWISRPRVVRTIGAIGTGAFLLASVDVIRFESDRAIFLGARPVVSWRWGSTDPFDVGSGAPTWRIAGVIGARF